MFRADQTPPNWCELQSFEIIDLADGADSSPRRRRGDDGLRSGRSLMSSPGNAAWCMAVRMSPGSTAYAPQGRLLGREGADEVVERGLARAVGAPALVVLDGGVGRDREDGAVGRDEVREQLPGEGRRGHHVGLQDGPKVCGSRVPSRAAGCRSARWRSGPAGPAARGSGTGRCQLRRWAPSVTDPATASTVVTRAIRS